MAWASWSFTGQRKSLAKKGNEVHLIELAENAVEYAKANMMQDCQFIAETGNALQVNRPDESADVVLLMGPQYHLRDRGDRLQSLREALRVLKKGGLLVAAGISKFSSMTWALSVYGEKKNASLMEFLDDPVFFNMIKGEMTSGDHIRPAEYPRFIAESYFTTSDEMKSEVAEAGFKVEKAIAVEGCIWFTPHLAEKWEDKANVLRRHSKKFGENGYILDLYALISLLDLTNSILHLLDIVRITESEPEMMGMSPHFLVVARK